MFLAGENPTEHSVADANNAVSNTPHRVTRFSDHSRGPGFPAFGMQAMSFGCSGKRDKRRKGNSYSEG